MPLAAEGCQPFLVGQKVHLRPLAEGDLAGPYLDWLNDPEVTRFMETGTFPTTPEGLRRYYEAVAQNPDNVMLAIVDAASGRHIGNVKLGPLHRIHRRADMGIMVGDKTFWGTGAGHEAVALVLHYGFDRLNLHKVTLGVYACHSQAVKLYESLGFKIEGSLREHLFRDGAYWEMYVMGILAEEYRTGARE